MNKAEIRQSILELMGEVDPMIIIPPESVEDSIVWAQDTLAARLGSTYVETSGIPVDADGIAVLPDPLVKPVRVWFDPVVALSVQVYDTRQPMLTPWVAGNLALNTNYPLMTFNQPVPGGTAYFVIGPQYRTGDIIPPDPPLDAGMLVAPIGCTYTLGHDDAGTGPKLWNADGTDPMWTDINLSTFFSIADAMDPLVDLPAGHECKWIMAHGDESLFDIGDPFGYQWDIYFTFWVNVTYPNAAPEKIYICYYQPAPPAPPSKKWDMFTSTANDLSNPVATVSIKPDLVDGYSFRPTSPFVPYDSRLVIVVLRGKATTTVSIKGETIPFRNYPSGTPITDGDSPYAPVYSRTQFQIDRTLEAPTLASILTEDQSWNRVRNVGPQSLWGSSKMINFTVIIEDDSEGFYEEVLMQLYMEGA